MLRKATVLALIALLFAGCDQKALLNKFVPKDDDAFARHFLEVVRAGDYTTAEQMLDGSLGGVNSAGGLHDLHEVLAHGEPLSVEIIGCNVFTNTAVQGTTRRTNLSYEIHFPGSWAAGNVVVGHSTGIPTVLGSHFQPVPDSLEVLSRFTLSGKSLVYYLVFAACLAVPSLILVTLMVCIRSRIRHKWLWMVFILLGFARFQLNWTTGQIASRPIAVVLFGASASRSGPYGPWILGCAIPVGAIIFLAFRRKLLRDKASQGV